MDLSTIVKSLKLENDDDKYVHIGYGKYKQKGHEDDENAPTFTKTDDGKYVKADGGGDGDDKASKPGMDIDAGGAVGGDEPSDEPSGDDYDLGVSADDSVGELDKPDFDELQYDIAQQVADKHGIGTEQVYDYMKGQGEYNTVQDVIDNAEEIGKKYSEDSGSDDYDLGVSVDDSVDELDKPDFDELQYDIAQQAADKYGLDDPVAIYDYMKGQGEYNTVQDIVNNAEEIGKKYSKNETITINGVKYRPLKESKKSKKHQLKEQYDRLFTSRTVI